MDDDSRVPAGDWEQLALPDACWRSTVSTPMRDGVELVADVYAATNNPTPRPVLLERTPYGRRNTRGSDGAVGSCNPAPPDVVCSRFTARGYVVVRQDCRGRFDSGGLFVKYLGEAEDGFDTVAWIARQPWCDGRVATMGVSYSAHAQSALASLGTPHVAAMFLDSGGFASAYETGVRMGGAFELKQATWAISRATGGASGTNQQVTLDRDSIEKWFGQLPWWRAHSPLSHAPDYEDYLFEQWEHADFGPFWEQLGLYGRGFYDEFPDVPNLHMSSWYDPYILTAIENFHELGRRKTSPSYLVLGPWTHGRRSDSFAGDVDFGPAAPLDGNLATDYAEMRADWFDAALGSTQATGPRVRYFLMGSGSGTTNRDGRLDHGGHWETCGRWPPEDTVATSFYLHGDGGLSEEPPTIGSHLDYQHDPEHPVPTIGGQVTSGEPLMVGGAFDQRPDERTFTLDGSGLPLDARADVLVFQTEPLTSEIVLAGPVSARLAVSSTAVDTDFAIKLVDVHPPSQDHPDGFAMNLTDGILRARYREGFRHPELMEPGREYEVTVRAPDTANRFMPGHRIRLDVSSSNFPRFDLNTGTGTPEVGDWPRISATNRVYVDGRSQLRLQLRRPPTKEQRHDR